MSNDQREPTVETSVAKIKTYLHERSMMRGLCQHEIHSLHVGTDKETFLETSDLAALVKFFEDFKSNK